MQHLSIHPVDPRDVRHLDVRHLTAACPMMLVDAFSLLDASDPDIALLTQAVEPQDATRLLSILNQLNNLDEVPVVVESGDSGGLPSRNSGLRISPQTTCEEVFRCVSKGTSRATETA